MKKLEWVKKAGTDEYGAEDRWFVYDLRRTGDMYIAAIFYGSKLQNYGYPLCPIQHFPCGARLEDAMIGVEIERRAKYSRLVNKFQTMAAELASELNETTDAANQEDGA